MKAIRYCVFNFTLHEENLVISTAKTKYIIITEFKTPLFFLYLSVLTYALCYYKGADKSLALPGRKQATETEDFEFHISHL